MSGVGGRGVVVAIAVALFAAVFVASPLHLPLNNPNEGVRVFTVKALVEHRSFAIDDVVSAWGFIDDKAFCGDDHKQRCASKAPFVSLVAAAAYAVVHPVTGDLDRETLTRVCRVTGGVFPAAFALSVLWWALRKRARAASSDVVIVDLAVVGSVVGSGVLASLNVFSGHALAALAPGAVLALALLDDEPTTKRLVTAAALLSMAACAEYPAALALPLVLLLVLRSRRRVHSVVVVVVSGVVVALPTLVAHTVMFGAPWRTGYGSLDNPAYRPLVEGSFNGVGLPDLGVLATVFMSPELGLFIFSPLLLAGVFGIARLAPAQRRVVVVVVACFCAFIAGFRGWRGGWSVGPRYISELIGIFSVTAVLALESLRFGRAVAFVGVAVGVVESGLAGAFFPHLPDNLHNPVIELVLPTIVRGFAPDSWPLWLGMSSSWASFAIVVVVGLPVVVVAVAHREVRGAFVVLALPLVALTALLPGSEAATRGREVRRLADNWRPARGVPYLDDGSDDVRVLFAIDRGRAARGRAIDCRFDTARPRRNDLGVGADIIAAVSDEEGLVVVDDALADHIGAAGGRAVVVDTSDVDRFLPQLPCEGDITAVMRPGTTLPKRLRALPEVERRDVDGFVVLRLAR